ncbi:MAG: hypothetical protein IJQ81_03685 [Oscillibacter sp.]|nr:hypothetical protein [Oscillibacter sp.]
MDFREKCPEIVGTALWETLKEKAGEDSEFLTVVGEICYQGVTLSKDVIRFFPTFTLHDATHISNVCAWMARLLGEQRSNLTKQEAALLLMSACCHDIGMSVSKEQEEALLNSRTDTLEWTSYFKSHRRDELAFLSAGKAAGLPDGEGKLTPEILRNYVRANHHNRIDEQLPRAWPDALKRNGISRQTLIDLCQSHGEPLEKLRFSSETRYDLRMCAAILRLSDLLDFDASRAPDALFRYLGLNRPQTLEERISAAEWSKNRAGVFNMGSDSTLFFDAQFDNLQQEKETQVYLDYVQDELRTCIHELHRHSVRWKELPLPYTISTERADRRGYRSGNFRLTMDQDKVIRLLTGKNLYTDAGVFVRELLQNAIDAVLYRAMIDPRFEVEDGHIVIRTWIDAEGDSWFRIEDNGIGMDEHIIEDYFLKVGRSYYTSDEFQLDKLHYGKRTPDGREDYTPISRFGIGFLSCFMSDPDYNRVQVSTKRFTQDPMRPNPGIRLDVTSLNGYYYLAVEGEQATWEDNFTPMAHPSHEDCGYRTEPGTTICVRANLYRMGGYRSFREIVDKYLCFPRFKVEYYGPEGPKVYPTQQELMDAVHAMNPDGPGHEPKKYEHPIPDEVFKELKAHKKCSELLVYGGRPSITLQYYPLDWYSDSGYISGFGVKATAEVNGPLMLDGEEYTINYLSLDCFNMTVSINFSLDDDNKNLHKSASLEITGNIVENWLRKDEFSFLPPNPRGSVFRGDVAYHGVFCAEANNTGSIISSPFSFRGRTFPDSTSIHATILLSGSYVPYVGMERDDSVGYPLETVCELTVIAHETNTLGMSKIALVQEKLSTVHEMRRVLEKHPAWEKYLKVNSRDGNFYSLQDIKNKFAYGFQKEIPLFMDPESAYDMLCLAAIRRDYAVSVDIKYPSVFVIQNASPDDTTLDFPCFMFFQPMEENMPFCRSCNYTWEFNPHNQEYRFSQWLIQKHKELKGHAPGLYEEMLATICIGIPNNQNGFVTKINSILTQLRGYRNNYFSVTDELFLTDADVV